MGAARSDPQRGEIPVTRANAVRQLPPCRLGKSCQIQAKSENTNHIIGESDFRRIEGDRPAQAGRPHKNRGGSQMEADLNFLGLMNLLRGLLDAGLVTRAEARRVAAHLKVETGADLVIFL